MSRGGRLHQWRRRLRRRWKQKPGLLPWLMALPVRVLLGLFRLLPPRWSLGFLERCGRLVWRSPRRREAGRAQLERAFPDLPAAERDRLGRISCGQMARSIGEALILARRFTPATLLEQLEFEPGCREILEGRAGQGTIFVQGHFGAMEGMDATLGILGLRLLTPMRFPNNYYLGRDLLKAREGWGVDLVGRKGALRAMLRRLREGGAVMLAADQNAHHAPIFVPWFGRLAASDRAAAYLALRLGLPLVVSWCVRRHGEWGWTVGCEVVRPAQTPAPADDAALAEVTARVHAALERAILRHPEQYLWIHDRYRTRPPGEPAAEVETTPAVARA